MRKKVIKYIKFLVSMVLILGLIAPSYASLSASDGSAFVTKSEFDSALADFNARLTTFEAGINSKIDSQVTSYLDRNGIWNGKDQNLANSNGIWDVADRNVCPLFYALFKDKNQSISFTVDKATSVGDVSNPILICSEISKAGLLYINYALETYGGKDHHNKLKLYYCGPSGTAWGMSYQLGFRWSTEEETGAATLSSFGSYMFREGAADSNGSTAWYEEKGNTWYLPTYSVALYQFVDQKDKVYWVANAHFISGSYNIASMTRKLGSAGNQTSGNYSGWKLRVKALKVY